MGKHKKRLRFCATHPVRQARRKCFTCGRPLCPACQTRAEGHVFCGVPCHRRFLRDARRERLRKTLVRASAHPATRWAALSLALGTLALVAYLALAALRHEEIYADSAATVAPFRAAAGNLPPLASDDVDWSLPGLLRLLEPSDRAETNAPRVAVRGEAPAGAIVGLYVNGELLDTALATEGNVTFDAPLPRDANTIQLRAFDRHGASAFSNAALVFNVGRMARKPRPLEVAEQPEEPAAAPDNVTRGPLDRRAVYLTFDGGSSANVAEDILRILNQRNVKATMFLTGQFIERYPELTRLMTQDGHVVGNHTYSHPHLTTFAATRRHQTLKGVTREFVHAQLDKTDALYREATGRGMTKVWRAPYGEHNAEIRRWAREAGGVHVGWTQGLDSLDWVAKKDSPLYAPMRQILQRLASFGEGTRHEANGAIILMHLGSERAPDERLPVILDDLIAEYTRRGYVFRTAEDFLR